jgi:outer membrane protein
MTMGTPHGSRPAHTGIRFISAALLSSAVLVTAVVAGAALATVAHAAGAPEAAAQADTASAKPVSITFNQAIDIALRQNNTLQRASNATEAQRIGVTQARMQFVPDLGLSLSSSASHTWRSGTAQAASASSGGKSFSAGLSSRVVLFDGLANVAGLREAGLQAEAAGLDEERTRQDVIFQVISGYLAMIEASEQARVREENLAAQVEQEQSVRVLVEEGERPIADLYQQQANVASARLSSVEARRTLDLSRVDLVQALQLDPTGEYVFAIPPLPETDREPPTRDLATLLERAFARRADLTAVSVREVAAGQGERAAKAGRWPNVSLSASYGAHYSGSSDVDFMDQLTDEQSGSLGLSLSMPLFDGLATRSAIERARLDVVNARLAREDMRQAVALQVRRAILDRNAAVEQLRAAEAQESAARQALDATSERYAAGAANLYEVTLARADFVAAASARVSARYNLLWQERLIDYYIGDLDAAGGLA